MPSARKLLYPFSLLYGGIMRLRNGLYDRGFFHSEELDVPVICVGNLSAGGTGKTPMVEYLISLLKEEHTTAVLSRGYRRSSSGFHLLDGTEKAAEVGDEPLQFKTKFPEVAVAVDEVRLHGIAQLLKLQERPELILLDDALQHRPVKADLNILLTPYNDLYTDDLVLPAGNLREPKKGAERAQVVVVTKCPAHLTTLEKDRITQKLNLRDYQQLYFSTIVYSNTVYSKDTSVPLGKLRDREVTLVTGIANPRPLVEFLATKGIQFDHLSYSDHHNFRKSEVEAFNNRELILTTEKDYMRLKGQVKEDRLFYLPIETAFIEDKEIFNSLIKAVAEAKK